MDQRDMNLKCRNQSHPGRTLGSLLRGGGSIAIQSYYTNHKGAAFTLGLITVMRIKSHFAAAFKTFWRLSSLPPSRIICMYMWRPPGAKALTRQTMTGQLCLRFVHNNALGAKARREWYENFKTRYFKEMYGFFGNWIMESKTCWKKYAYWIFEWKEENERYSHPYNITVYISQAITLKNNLLRQSWPLIVHLLLGQTYYFKQNMQLSF